jgi:hypothetical protein
MHGGAKTEGIWPLLAERYPAIDEVTITNREGAIWTCKALANPG